MTQKKLTDEELGNVCGGISQGNGTYSFQYGEVYSRMSFGEKQYLVIRAYYDNVSADTVIETDNYERFDGSALSGYCGYSRIKAKNFPNYTNEGLVYNYTCK